MNTLTLDLRPAEIALAARKEAFDRFAQLLTEQNRTMNLTRIDTPEHIQTRHFMDSLAALAVLDEVAAATTTSVFSMIDVGSGAGFPGLAIAIARPEWRIVSLEATDKKVHFQRQVCDKLNLANVDVRHGRAEAMAQDPALREQFNVAAARALAGLDVLAELTMAFVRPGGAGIFWKGPQVQEEIVVSGAAFEKMGAAITRLLDYKLPENTPVAADSTLFLAIAEKRDSTPTNYPRQNYAAIKKRPLR